MEVLNFEEMKHEKSKRYRSSGSSSFNTLQSVHGGFNWNTQAGDGEEEEVYQNRHRMGMDRAKAQKKKGAASSASSGVFKEEALVRLLVNEYISASEPYNGKRTHNIEAFLEIKRRELELKQQEMRIREMEQHQKTKCSISITLIT